MGRLLETKLPDIRCGEGQESLHISLHQLKNVRQPVFHKVYWDF